VKKSIFAIVLLALLSAFYGEDASRMGAEEFLARLKRVLFNLAITVIFLVGLYRFVLYEINHLK
jgi:hypothetical protein